MELKNWPSSLNYSTQLGFGSKVNYNQVYRKYPSAINTDAWLKITSCCFSSSNDKVAKKENENLTKKDSEDPKVVKGVFKEDFMQKERFRAFLRDYGTTAVAFHISFSLICLGTLYLLVKSSFPMENLIYLLNAEKYFESAASKGSAQFVIAFAVNRALLPFRALVTVTCVPFIVRFLRRKNIISEPKLTHKTKL